MHHPKGPFVRRRSPKALEIGVVEMSIALLCRQYSRLSLPWLTCWQRVFKTLENIKFEDHLVKPCRRGYRSRSGAHKVSRGSPIPTLSFTLSILPAHSQTRLPNPCLSTENVIHVPATEVDDTAVWHPDWVVPACNQPTSILLAPLMSAHTA